MRLFGKHVFPGQIILFASGLLFLASTTYDVHRSIKNNQTPPTEEQLKALEDYIKSAEAKQRTIQHKETEVLGNIDNLEVA